MFRQFPIVPLLVLGLAIALVTYAGPTNHPKGKGGAHPPAKGASHHPPKSKAHGRTTEGEAKPAGDASAPPPPGPDSGAPPAPPLTQEPTKKDGGAAAGSPPPPSSSSSTGCPSGPTSDSFVPIKDDEPQSDKFVFPDGISPGTEYQLLGSLMNDQSPSKSSDVDWTKLVHDKYIAPGKDCGPNPSQVLPPFDAPVPPPPGPLYNTTCQLKGEVGSLAIIAPVYKTFILTTDVGTICAKAKSDPTFCKINCDPVCDPVDWWKFQRKQETHSRTADEEDESLKIEPQIPSGNWLRERLLHELETKLSPSPNTNINWAEYIQKFRLKTLPQDNPPMQEALIGTIVARYRAKANCTHEATGIQYTVEIDVFKDVEFGLKKEDHEANCKKAKEEKLLLPEFSYEKFGPCPV